MPVESVYNVLPLLRIKKFFPYAGDTVTISNIGILEARALSFLLNGGSGPISPTGKLALAVDYSTELSTVAEATLVRIKEVSKSDQPDMFNAQLFVLCQSRVCDVSTWGPFPTARRALDLTPLWRIRQLELAAFVIQIGHITREDTPAISMLTKLGGGDVKGAEGHMVLACDFKATVAAGQCAGLVRINKVTCSRNGGPPYGCTLKVLGHVRCASVDTTGAFPQVLLDEIPAWPIPNLNAGGGGPEHIIRNISRPDSVALLTYLGQGNPLAAAGGLVIGCDSSSPPAVGESGRLMRVASIHPSTGAGSYEAQLDDVSSVTIGAFHYCEGHNWWPRVTVVLPKVWKKPVRPIEPLVTMLTPVPAMNCPYWLRCQNALRNLIHDVGIQLTGWYAEERGDKCFCFNCHRLRGDNPVYPRPTGAIYVLPVGFARTGLKPSKTHALIEWGMEHWHVCFHGVNYKYLGDICRAPANIVNFTPMPTTVMERCTASYYSSESNQGLTQLANRLLELS